jgi:hypothetical protein
MALGRGEAKLRVTVDADTRAASAELKGFSAKATGAIAGIASAGATVAIDAAVAAASKAATFLVDATTKAGDLSAALSTTAQVFGDATGRVTEWSKQAAQGLGLSQLEALNAARAFSVYGEAIGLTGDPLAAFTEELSVLAADLGAFANLPTEQAIEALGSAFRKERDPLEKFGIMLTDAEVKAGYLAATGEEVTGTLTTQQNIIGTLAAVQEQAATATGSFAREQDELGNQSQRNAAELENLQTKIGSYLLPVVQELAKWVGETLLPTLEEWGDYLVNELWPAIQDLANIIGEKLSPFVDMLREAWEKLSPELQKAWDRLSELKKELQPVIDLVGKLAGGLFLGLLASVIMSVVAGFTLFSYILKALVAVWDTVGKPMVEQAVDAFETMRDAVGWVVDKIGRLIELLRTAKDLAGGFLGGVIDKIPGLGRTALELTTGGLGRSSSPAAYTYAPTYNVSTTVPLGVHAGDVGAAIVAAIRDWEARNGPAPIGGAA